MTGPIAHDPLDLVARELHDLVRTVPGARVLDVGGGTGNRAVPLALTGCRVTVVDSSTDALAILARRAAEAGVSDSVTGLQADADALTDVVRPGRADLVLCHHVLEAVDDARTVMRALVDALRPGGLLSVVVAGRFAAVLGRAISGRFAQASAILADPDGRYGQDDPVLRRFDVASLHALFTDAGLSVRTVTGIGVAEPLVSGPVRQSQSDSADSFKVLETALGEHPVMRELATDLHAVAERPR